MPRSQYTHVAEAPKGSFGPRDRFIDQHGLPGRRKEISDTSLRHKYKQIKKLNNTGALNEGIWKAEKLEGQRAGKVCVLKKIAFNPEEGRLLLREIEILHVLKHPNIVGFIEACIPPGNEGIAELFLEYCDQGDLHNVLNKYIKYNEDYSLPDHPFEWVPEGFVWHVFRSLASAVAYLHYGVSHDDMDDPPRIDKQWPYILHRDIKPENILLKSRPSNSDTLPQRSNYPTVVLADFGVCTQKNEDRLGQREDDPMGPVGTFRWQAPELPLHSKAGEVWTIGVIAMSLCRQFKHGPVKAEKADSYKGRLQIKRLQICQGFYTVQLQDTVRYALHWEPEDRPASPELLGKIRTTEAKLKRHVGDVELPDWVFE